MRLHDLITIYEDVIKKHDMFEVFKKYTLQIIVDVNSKTFDDDDLVIIVDFWGERVFLLSGLHQSIQEWLEDNLPEKDDYGIIYKGSEVDDDVE